MRDSLHIEMRWTDLQFPNMSSFDGRWIAFKQKGEMSVEGVQMRGVFMRVHDERCIYVCE